MGNQMNAATVGAADTDLCEITAPTVVETNNSTFRLTPAGDQLVVTRNGEPWHTLKNKVWLTVGDRLIGEIVAGDLAGRLARTSTVRTISTYAA